MRHDIVTCVIVFSLSLLPRTSSLADIVVRDLDNVSVGGQWQLLNDDTYSIQPGMLDLDVNQDGQLDVRFEHGYRRPPLYFSTSAVQQIDFASQTLAEAGTLLESIHRLAADSASASSTDEDSFEANQSEVANALEIFNRIGYQSIQGARLLAGDAGKSGITSSPHAFEVAAVTRAPYVGATIADIRTAGRRATVSTNMQSPTIAQDELLMINGAKVQLYAGMDTLEVIDRINEYTGLSHAIAFPQGTMGIVIMSDDWGTRSEVAVASNLTPGPTTTGFPDQVVVAHGANVQVTMDGGRILEGDGDTVVVTEGLASGLVLRILPDPTDPTKTIERTHTTVTLLDNSPSYLLLPAEQNQSITISYPRINTLEFGGTSALGAARSLSQIDVTSNARARDALVVVDAAINELHALEAEFDLIRTTYISPVGQIFATSLFDSNESNMTLDLQVLDPGTVVDDHLVFNEGPIDLALAEDSSEGRFLGFRLSTDSEQHYGWIRYTLDDERRISLKQVVYESSPGRGVVVGSVPEPTLGIVAIGSVVLAFGAMRKRHLRRAETT
ncbi:MAG: hypothetical protein KDB23_13480 [Planctomycetales bacterium]|nr:hypothetical protein [Planctomycetales bacterium]